MKRSSLHLRMRDGVRLAVDVHLPSRPAGRAVPTILRATRYLRSVEYAFPFGFLPEAWFFDTQRSARGRFLEAGYAWIDVDVRGSGASTGCWTMPWSPELVRDLGEVVDWAVAQPWSNGRVGALGISYDGTCAEFLLANRHPAVRAVAPRFCLHDVYTDVAFPGGVRHEWFIRSWQALNDGFDENRPADFLEWWAPTWLRGLFEARGSVPLLREHLPEVAGNAAAALMRRVLRGVTPVPGAANDPQAEEDRRANCNLVALAEAADCRDDPPADARMAGQTVDTFSPHAAVDAIDSSGAAVFSYGGWYDGAYASGALSRHRALTNPLNRVLVGPWNHGGTLEVDPAGSATRCRFDHDGELLRFFDRHLRGSPAEDDTPPVRYFTAGKGWSSAETWPPPALPRSLYLTADGGLGERPPASGGARRIAPDSQASSGHRNRWKGYIGMPPDYSDRRRRDERLAVFDSAPLSAPLEVTGNPVLVLHAAADVPDWCLFAYLEEVRPGGEVAHVTEGALRPAHRPGAGGKRDFARRSFRPAEPGTVEEIPLELLPTSYLFSAGSRIRVALAFADTDNFGVPAVPRELSIACGPQHPSRIVLPVP